MSADAVLQVVGFLALLAADPARAKLLVTEPGVGYRLRERFAARKDL